MELQKIKHLIDLLAASDLSELELVEGDQKVRLVKRVRGGKSDAEVRSAATPALPASALHARYGAPAARTAEDDRVLTVSAPLYGTVHLSPSPGAPAFVAQGDAVQAGQTLCVMEAMKTFHEVKAGKAARVTAIFAGSGQEVEAGQPLFRLDAPA